MVKITQANKEEVLAKIKAGRIDAASLNGRNIIEIIMKKMLDIGIIDELERLVEDKRQGETSIPLKLPHTLAITAKMKVKTSLTDMPFAIEDTELLSEIGYNMVKTEKIEETEEKGLVGEGEYRFPIGKYDGNEFLSGYKQVFAGKYFTGSGNRL